MYIVQLYTPTMFNVSADYADFEFRLDRIESQLAIQQLSMRYALAVDARDLDAWVQLFVDDVDCGKHGVGREALKRFIDPNIHGPFLRELHELIIETDNQSQAMLDFLQKEVETAIRDLSICILTPGDPKYNLDDQIRRFDDVVVQLQQLQEALQTRILHAKSLSDHVTKT